jgi:hypothetical protein
MGIPVYLDEGSQVGLENQPFWYGGLLYIYNMGRFNLRAPLDTPNTSAPPQDPFQRFDRAASELASRGGGVISIYYHPTEFVTTEFWDLVNFAKGADREPAAWQRPRRRTDTDSERCYRVLRDYVAHMKAVPGVRFVTARELLQLYATPQPAPLNRPEIARHLAAKQTFLLTANQSFSAADILLALLGMDPQHVDGPATRGATTLRAATVSRPAFDRAKADAVSFIRMNQRLPDVVWIASEKLSLGNFAATLAADELTSASVAIHPANLEFEKYFSSDPTGAFGWPIHPEGFAAPELLDLARLQGWTLKPARLR